MANMWNFRKIKLIVSACLVLAVVFVTGLYVGVKSQAESKISNILQKEPQSPLAKEVDFGLFWQAWNLLERKYVDIEKVERQDMVYGAVSGLFKSVGDPYTVFLPPRNNEEFEAEIKGEFEGVGMEIGIRKGILTVVAPLKDTPAERAGIMAGDKILKINDTITSDITIDEAVHLIRGQKGTNVKLVILRNGEDENRVIEVKRGVIKIPVLDTEREKTVAKIAGERGEELHLDDIFVIRLYNFSENSPVLFRNALREMITSGKQKLILDLRNNPGGFLEASVDIASWFLPQGEVVVLEESGNKEHQRTHRSRGYNIFRNLPMVILVNQGSASASEILAGALRDHGIAKLVGEKTFGKGSVQELLSLTPDTSVKITVAKWLTPKGQEISEVGLAPDFEVKPTEEDIKIKSDPIMKKAIEILKTMP